MFYQTTFSNQRLRLYLYERVINVFSPISIFKLLSTLVAFLNLGRMPWDRVPVTLERRRFSLLLERLPRVNIGLDQLRPISAQKSVTVFVSGLSVSQIRGVCSSHTVRPFLSTILPVLPQSHFPQIFFRSLPLPSHPSQRTHFRIFSLPSVVFFLAS